MQHHNPFSDDYLRQEIDFLNLPEDTDVTLGDCEARLRIRPMSFGRLDAYLNVDLVHFDPPIGIPIYTRDSTFWMSLTPMEVQSMYVPIQRAIWAETVALGGLGLGYAALRIAANAREAGQAVQVDVYEQDEDCIQLFERFHGDRPEREDINIIHGDVREKLVGKTYDLCFMDIYESMLQDEVPADLDHFMTRNTLGEYRWWTQELAVFEAANAGANDVVYEGKSVGVFTFEDTQFFRMFSESEGSNLRSRHVDQDWCIETMGQHNFLACNYMGEVA